MPRFFLVWLADEDPIEFYLCDGQEEGIHNLPVPRRNGSWHRMRDKVSVPSAGGIKINSQEMDQPFE